MHKVHCNLLTIFIASKPENAEIYAIKNDYATVEGGDEVWIRGSKMIGNRKLFGITYARILLK